MKFKKFWMTEKRISKTRKNRKRRRNKSKKEELVE
jgi:hypothetical protein